MLRRGDVCKYGCESCVSYRGLTILVGTLTNWLFIDVSVCATFCAEAMDSGVVHSLVLLSLLLEIMFSL